MADPSLLREIEQDLRNEKLRRLWRRFAPWIVGGVVFVVASVSVGVGYQHYQTHLRESWGDLLIRSLSDTEEQSWQDAKIPLKDLIGQAAAGYDSLARFQQASLYIQDNKIEQAIALYDQLEQRAATKPLRDLAVLLSTYYQLDQEDTDVLLRKLAPLLDKDNLWHDSALEMQGYLFLKQERYPDARQVFTHLQDNDAVPQGIRNRARDMLLFIGKQNPTP
ncbi:MAG: tetratricopeptide repeat protein [Alphaproteobacteria bacterium GM7ARS4]|nr:tetratricopeptide repeat protein [Alphaproteobacteria bacterium GM7ARS4]